MLFFGQKMSLEEEQFYLCEALQIYSIHSQMTQFVQWESDKSGKFQLTSVDGVRQEAVAIIVQKIFSKLLHQRLR